MPGQKFEIDFKRIVMDFDYIFDQDVMIYLYNRLYECRKKQYQYDPNDHFHFLFFRKGIYCNFINQLEKMSKQGETQKVHDIVHTILHLENPNKRIYYNPICVVCYEYVSAIVTNCNHHVLCPTCFKKICSPGGNGLCPICRSKMTTHREQLNVLHS